VAYADAPVAISFFRSCQPGIVRKWLYARCACEV